MNENILKSNEKLVLQFGAKKISEIKNLPDFYTFNKKLVYSHRDFDKFLKALDKGEKCAIVSGVNASGSLHLGHKVIFDTNLFFQKKYNIPVFIPISDDESYVSGKVKNQKIALKNAMNLAKELLAYGFNPKKTFLIIDQIYTNIYNLAFKLSVKLTLSQIKAVYGYDNETNPGLLFYPTVQSAHILLPQEVFGIKHVLVPIGPDEDNHLRVCRDIATKFNYNKPSVIHMKFMPGIDNKKMSKSKGNGIYLNDTPKEIKKKVNKSFSGGRDSLEEHRRLGGKPDIDISCIYLSNYFYNKTKSKELFDNYKSGKLLSGEVKKLLIDELIDFTQKFQKNKNNITKDTINQSLLKNKSKPF